METIYLTNDEIAQYPLFVNDSHTANILEYNEKELLKIFRVMSKNTIITLEWIEKSEMEFILVPELLIFKKYVHDEFSKVGTLLDKGYKTSLNKLSLSNTSISDLIQIYKNIGKVLETLQHLREKEKILSTFFIGDMHEGNILVDLPSKKIQFIDLDSCKIGDNQASIAKYLGSIALRKPTLSKKYPHDEYNLIPNHNTDLYCYMVMIIQTFFGRSITFSKINHVYQTIQYLKTQEELPEPLYQALLRLYTPLDNINPYPYLDDLGEVLERKLNK